MSDPFERPAGWSDALIGSGLAIGRFRAGAQGREPSERCTARHDGRCPGIEFCLHCPWAPPVEGDRPAAAT
jgi:hypothetical protein